MGLQVKCFPHGLYGENTYIATDESTGNKAVIDPGYFGEGVKNEIGSKENLKYILLTHGHFDHFAELVNYISEYPDAKFVLPEKEVRLFRNCKDNKYMSYSYPKTTPPDPDIKVSEGDVIKLGDSDIKVIETPGHTAGGASFATDKELFSGDTIFRLSVGRTDLETGDWDTLVSSIRHKLYNLDDETIVYPGHGAATTIGYEKRANPFV